MLSIKSLAGVISDDADSRQIDDGFDIGPTIWVPAEPWVSLTKNDGAVSHLVSIFFNYINPYWRVVERDHFVRTMRSKQPSSLCSPLLVHAILAMASVS